MRWRNLSALALPFVIGAIVLQLAVAPAGDAIAGAVARAAPAAARRAPAAGSPATSSGGVVASAPPTSHSGVTDRAAARPPAARATPGDAGGDGADMAHAPAPRWQDAKPKATIAVNAAAVARAMRRRDVGAINATAADGSPLGARLVGVNGYRAGLRDGDVIVSVGGIRTPDVDALVRAGVAAAGRDAIRIEGRIVRGDVLYAVVVAVPQ